MYAFFSIYQAKWGLARHLVTMKRTSASRVSRVAAAPYYLRPFLRVNHAFNMALDVFCREFFRMRLVFAFAFTILVGLMLIAVALTIGATGVLFVYGLMFGPNSADQHVDETAAYQPAADNYGNGVSSRLQSPRHLVSDTDPNYGRYDRSTDFQYRPSFTAKSVGDTYSSVRDWSLSRKMVDVSPHYRGGTYVDSYSRQPPGGIGTAEQIEAGLTGAVVVAGAMAIDAGLQYWEHRKQQANAR